MSVLTLANARLIDPEAGTETPGWLRIEDGRISARGTGAPPARPSTAGGTAWRRGSSISG